MQYLILALTLSFSAFSWALPSPATDCVQATASGSSGDTRQYVPCVKNTLSSYSSTTNAAVALAGEYYLAGCGDSTGATWSLGGDSIPGSVSINSSTGLISGAATTVGTYSVELRCQNTTTGSDYRYISFTWTVSGDEGLTGPNNYFVDSSAGVDPGDCSGGTVSNPWKTLSKATACVSATGADVWLKTGSVFEDVRFLINWKGTATDFATVGCYKVSGGVGFRCDDTDPKPEINGTFDEACRQTIDPSSNTGKGCHAFGGYTSTVTGAVPPGIDDALVYLPSSQGAVYVWVENIHIKDSAGRGFGTGRDNRYVAFVDSVIDYSGGFAFVGEQNTKDILVKGSTFRWAAWCSMWWRRGTAEPETPTPCQNNYPNTLRLSTNTVSNGLSYAILEDNDMYESYGDGYSINGGQGVIMRGNRIRSVRQPAFLMDHARQYVVESNIVWDANPASAERSEMIYGVTGVAHTHEPLSFHRSSFDVLIRNNIFADSSYCGLATNWSYPTYTDEIRSAWYNNTCVLTSPVTGGWRFNPSSSIGKPIEFFQEIRLRNNIVYAPNAGSEQSCSSREYVIQDFENNFFYPAPASICLDRTASNGGDFIQKPVLALDADNWNYTAAGWTMTSGPSYSDIVLSGDGVGDGVPLEANHGYLEPDEFFWWDYMDYPYVPDKAIWRKTVGYDFNGNVRNPTAPTIGAWEPN